MSRTVELSCDSTLCICKVLFVCTCRRCLSEPDVLEKFHTCEEHKETVAARHAEIRGPQNVVKWLPVKNMVTAGELFARARDCLASTSCRSEDREVQGNKSRSYVGDARLFTRALLLVELLVKDGHVEIEVERE